MKTAFSLLTALLLVGLTNAQQLTVSKAQIQFATTNEHSSSTESFYVKALTDTVTISNAKFYSIYQSNPYSLTNTLPITILPGDSVEFTVEFQPKHNIVNNSELVLENSATGAEAIDLIGQGTYSLSYYSATENTIENDLKAALKTITTNGMNAGSYNSARDEMFMVIDNEKVNGQGAAVNTLHGVYTRLERANYTNRTDAQNVLNTEHTFPQGFFNSNLPMRADIHHLFVTKISANSERGNMPFGEVSNPTWSDGGSQKDGSVFEPRDDHKGRTARAMMYFVVRYQDYSNFFAPQESVLRNWHLSYLPNAIDSARNNDIYAFQNNRNPFVDYPQFVHRITSLVSNSVATISTFDVTGSVADFGEIYQNSNNYKNIVVTNIGNQALTVNQIQLSGTAFSVNPSANFTVDANESIEIQIALNQGANPGTYSETLSFDVNGTTQTVTVSAVVLPALTNVKSSIGWTQTQPKVLQKSNEVIVEFSAPVQQYKLVAADGKLVGSSATYGSNRIAINKQGLAAGVYYLQYSTENQQKSIAIAVE